MRTKYEFNKFPAIAVTLTIIGLVLAVVATSISMMVGNDGSQDGYHFGGLAIMEVIAAVLFLAGLTTNKGTMVKIISIVLTVGLVITSFVLTIVKFSDRDVLYFAICLMMLIASVLELIYFLSIRYSDSKISKMYIVASICFCCLVAIYGLIYTIIDLVDVISYNYPGHFDNYLLLFSFAVISSLPFVSFLSLAKKEKEPEEPQA